MTRHYVYGDRFGPRSCTHTMNPTDAILPFWHQNRSGRLACSLCLSISNPISDSLLLVFLLVLFLVVFCSSPSFSDGYLRSSRGFSPFLMDICTVAEAKKRAPNDEPDIGDGIWIEILSRLDPRTLTRLKCTSKTWHRLASTAILHSQIKPQSHDSSSDAFVSPHAKNPSDIILYRSHPQLLALPSPHNHPRLSPWLPPLLFCSR